MALSRTRPILVAGRSGQLARSLAELAAHRNVPLIALGRPQFDLEQPDLMERIVVAAEPSAIVNAGAYTAVDQAEFEPKRALSVNRDGAGRLAEIASRLRIPFIHVSTDYVFDGRKSSPYQENDHPSPLGVYGHSKLEGERAVLSACPSAVVLRTAWAYSPHGANFVKTMLRLAETREVVRVVDDQHGAPTATRDLAHAILDLMPQFDKRDLAGIYHLTATGATTWHGFANAIFEGWARRGGRVPVLERIGTAAYPTPARRPANCRLDCSKIESASGIRLPEWQVSLESCLDLLFEQHVSRSLRDTDLSDHSGDKQQKEPVPVQSPAL
jgi:dTDP-4-dehydrorhamnose reductase